MTCLMQYNKNAARIINFKTSAVYYLVSKPVHNFNNLFSILRLHVFDKNSIILFLGFNRTIN